MEILKIKDNGNSGYIVNDTMSVPNAKGNRHYVMIQEWIANGGIVEPFETQAEIDARLIVETLAVWKANRAQLVDNIEVIYNGVVYQGDEESQTRMARAIVALPDDTTTINWIAKDNTVNALTRVDLKLILLDAGNQQSAIWNAERP